MERVHIEKNTIQETLVIPLYARKLCSERFPELFRDEKAMELMERLDYDFSRMEKDSHSLMQRFGALEVAMRQNDLAIEVRDYLRGHPNAAVVNLGCGLDQTAESCDNGCCNIYNVDLPDVIAVRNSLLPEGERVKNIAADLKDSAWFEQIDGSQGAVFFAAGVFYYFRRHEVKALVHKMARHFPDSRLVFDTAGKKAVAMMIKTWVKQAGIEKLGYNDLKAPSVSPFFRFLAKLGDRVMRMQIVRIDFESWSGEWTAIACP